MSLPKSGLHEPLWDSMAQIPSPPITPVIARSSRAPVPDLVNEISDLNPSTCPNCFDGELGTDSPRSYRHWAKPHLNVRKPCKPAPSGKRSNSRTTAENAASTGSSIIKSPRFQRVKAQIKHNATSQHSRKFGALANAVSEAPIKLETRSPSDDNLGSDSSESRSVRTKWTTYHPPSKKPGCIKPLRAKRYAELVVFSSESKPRRTTFNSLSSTFGPKIKKDAKMKKKALQKTINSAKIIETVVSRNQLCSSYSPSNRDIVPHAAGHRYPRAIP